RIDIDPACGGCPAEEGAFGGEEPGIREPRDGKGRWVLHPPEYLGLEHVQPREHEAAQRCIRGDAAAGGGKPDDAWYGVGAIGLDHPVRRRAGVRSRGGLRDPAVVAVEGEKLAEWDLEQAVAVGDDEGLVAEQRARVRDAAARVEDWILVRVAHAH